MTQTIYREVSRASAIARAAVLSISIFHVAISFGGTIYYYVGASNKWNSAACYSLTDGGDGGAGIPGPDDSIRISKDQTVYLDDSTIGFLNGVREVSFRADNATAYVHLENDFNLECWFGDVDDDGSITAADARLALRRAVQLETFEADSAKYLAADVDKDGAVTASDARLILRKAVNLDVSKEGWGGKK